MTKSITVYFSTNRLPFRVSAAERKIYKSGIAFGSDASAFDGKALRFGRPSWRCQREAKER